MLARFVRPWSVAALAVGVAVHGLGGCGTTSGLAGLGEGCSVATDCAPGLVCVVQKSGGRACSDDLSSVLGEPPPSDDGMDGGAEPEDDGGGDAGPAVEEDASPGEPDAASPDAGSPGDAGGPPPDAGEPDAGEPEPDAGGEDPDASDDM